MTYEFPKRCRSCAVELVGPWCHACGQGHRHGRLSARSLIGEVAEGVLDLDGRVFRTFWGLTVRPGAAIREYLGGRRVPYLHPFKYALGIVALVFLSFELRRRLAGETPADLDFGPDEAQLLILAMTPATALYLRALFARGPEPVEVDGDPGDGRFRWIEHLVVTLYLAGHGMLLTLAVGRLDLALGAGPALHLWLQLLTWLAYASWVCATSYRTRWWTTIPRVALVVVLTAASMGGGILLLSQDIRDALFVPAKAKWERDS